jgi:hypothetical protein
MLKDLGSSPSTREKQSIEIKQVPEMLVSRWCRIIWGI